MRDSLAPAELCAAAPPGDVGAGRDLASVTDGLRSGSTAHAIAEIATGEQTDVIMVGTRGRTALAGVL
jgi:nucleotide-binding universal stress UspA family protein